MARQAKDGSVPSDKAERSVRWADYGVSVGGDSAFTWGQYDPADLVELIRRVTKQGDAISFAVNRPRTGGSITILAGGPPVKLYVNDDRSWNEAYHEIVSRYPDA
jgi:hypothetical protein